MTNTKAKFVKQLNRYIRIVGVALSVVTTPAASFELGSADERAVCAPDVFRLCGSEIPNVDRIIACMKANKANLNAPCKAVFDKAPATKAVENSH
jgi:hypothetical protein